MKEKNAVEQMGVRLVRERTLWNEEPVTTAKKAAAVIAAEYADYDREVFGVINMDNKLRIINFGIISIGGTGSAPSEPACFIRHSLLSGATRVILFHTHTSGIMEPSMADCSATQELIDAYHLMKMEVLDHIIIGSNGQYYTFRENERLQFSKKDYPYAPEEIRWQSVAEEKTDDPVEKASAEGTKKAYDPTAVELERNCRFADEKKPVSYTIRYEYAGSFHECTIKPHEDPMERLMEMTKRGAVIKEILPEKP